MNGIEHIIVLMLENRSFDHMLGLLDHPKKPDFPEDFLKGDEYNEAGGKIYHAAPSNARYGVIKEPGHEHENVKAQMGTTGQASTMKGFAQAHLDKKNDGDPQEVMRMYRPDQVPVLSALAKQYCLCTHWHCSVPGATWPNRFFAMAAQSSGHMDNEYFQIPVDITSIFHVLKAAEQAGSVQENSWGIFHDGLFLSLLVKGMVAPEMISHYRKNSELLDIIKKRPNELPAFSWVEPDHFGRDSSSQHPGFMDKKYEEWAFLSADNFIADIYDALKSQPELFKKTLFVVTYDEHGGFYDHVAPPYDAAPPNQHNPKNLPFNLLGPRVPAVLINPRIASATIDRNTYEHSSIVRMVADLLLDGDVTPLASERLNTAGNPLAGMVLDNSLNNIIDLERKVPAKRPKDWQVDLANGLDDLQAKLMSGAAEICRKLREEKQNFLVMDAGSDAGASILSDVEFYLGRGSKSEGFVPMAAADEDMSHRRQVADLAHDLVDLILERKAG